jgi:hypothetical protein
MTPKTNCIFITESNRWVLYESVSSASSHLDYKAISIAGRVEK